MCNSLNIYPSWDGYEMRKPNGKYLMEDPKDFITIVQEWSDEHPVEIDWTKVPVDTPVIVQGKYDSTKEKRKFTAYVPALENKFLCFYQDYNSIETTHITAWYFCELDPSVDPTPYLKD